MINKDSFVKIMDTLRDYDDAIDVIYSELGISMDDNAFTRVLDRTLDALFDDVESNFYSDERDLPWCYYYAFELDWGRAANAETATEIDGVAVPLTNAGQLYDLLVDLQNKE